MKQNEQHKRAIEQAITDFVKGGDNSDVVLLSKVLHKDFRITNMAAFHTLLASCYNHP